MTELPTMTKDANGNCQYLFSSEHVRIWGNKGVMPRKLVDYYFDSLTKNQQEHLKLLAFRKENPNATQEETMKVLRVPLHEDIQMAVHFLDFLHGNWGVLISSLIEEDQRKGLFENVVGQDKLGIVRLITDSMYHLNKLLKEAVLTNLYENIYEVKSVIKNSRGERISLVFSFSADSIETASGVFEDYKKMMITKGLKTWIAHWGLANEFGRTEYSCAMTKVMKLLAEDDRQAHFSVKEKQEHWAITKMLGMTKLLRERIVKKKGTSTMVTRWVEQPLLEILGGERKLEVGDKYPELLAVRVLAPQPDMKGFVPAIYHKETCRLHPTDIYLAFAIQTRASMRNRGESELNFDWKFLFELGNLEGTAQSNQRVAKAMTRKKMDRFQQKEIIDGWNEESTGVRITPKSQNQKQPKSEND